MLLAHIPIVWKDPKTTLRFNDLLEGLTELRKSGVFMVFFTLLLYFMSSLLSDSKRMQIKISSEKRCLGEAVQEEPGTSFTFLLPVTSHGEHLILPGMMSESRALLTLREAHPDLASRLFI